MSRHNEKKIPQIVIVDDLEKCEKDVLEALAQMPDRSACRFIINSGGGSVYAGLGMSTLIEMKHLKATAVVLADCSSSALLVFATCQERLVAPHASFLFHPMQWSSEERSRLSGALGWAKEFERIEDACADWLRTRLGITQSVLARWVKKETYVTAHQLVELGLASYIPEIGSSLNVVTRPGRRGKDRAAGGKRHARVVPAARRKVSGLLGC
jgi:ATP-dependent protease ClpP protease subunit